MKANERPLDVAILQPLKGKINMEFVKSTGWLQVMMWPIFSVMLEKLYLLKG